MLKKIFNVAYKSARKIVVATVGITVILIGIILLVTPGPALIVIPAGLGILALEFAWARRWLKRLRESAETIVHKEPTNDHKP